MMSHKCKIAKAFGQRAQTYDAHATLQADVAQTLASLLPPRTRPKVLEVGCGTGLMTRHLLETYQDGQFLITDLSEDMLAICAEKFPATDYLRFQRMDGEKPEVTDTYDVIATSMALQWFTQPTPSLQRLQRLLNKGGAIYYATLGPQSFLEWREALHVIGAPSGLIEPISLPGVFFEAKHVMPYDSARAFLRSLKAIGAQTSPTGYHPMSPQLLKEACTYFDARFEAVTWHIVYGVLA